MNSCCFHLPRSLHRVSLQKLLRCLWFRNNSHDMRGCHVWGGGDKEKVSQKAFLVNIVLI